LGSFPADAEGGRGIEWVSRELVERWRRRGRVGLRDEDDPSDDSEVGKEKDLILDEA